MTPTLGGYLGTMGHCSHGGLGRESKGNGALQEMVSLTQHAFRAQRRREARARQSRHIQHLATQLVHCKQTISSWQRWWDYYAYSAERWYTREGVGTEHVPGEDSPSTHSLPAAGAVGHLDDDTVSVDDRKANIETSEDTHKSVEERHRKDINTEEEIQDGEEGNEEELGPDGHPANKLYVQRAQSKGERQVERRDKIATTATAGSSSKRQGVNLYVKNLDESTDDAALRALFVPIVASASEDAPRDDTDGYCYSHDRHGHANIHDNRDGDDAYGPHNKDQGCDDDEHADDHCDCGDRDIDSDDSEYSGLENQVNQLTEDGPTSLHDIVHICDSRGIPIDDVVNWFKTREFCALYHVDDEARLWRRNPS
eukprot:CAMPEP_0179226012 /NCGR_PEP_ID=MMETSP0797-20121207/8595_1 /TAXON_ID=47934 /ORGANISM="Dinophysis acuminata, Strain DAEP01" /LENGTH=368 /DNA_ID=CAMNT_0020933029 /DNA_START=79 /DNA_END=1185 /DNA_ORIENTATION=-